MNPERDRFLTEAMGQCWHDYDPDKPVMTYSLIGYLCTKCGNFILANNDFSTGEDMAKLLAWASDREDLRGIIPPQSADRLSGPGALAEEREELAEAIYRRLKE